MRIVTATRLELLAASFASELAASPPEPLAEEVVVVPGQGMRRWLTLRLADHLGVAASFAMEFPAQFVHGLLDAAAGEDVESGRAVSRHLDRDALTWRLFRLLGAHPPDALAAFLDGDDDGTRRAQLARRLAGRFDEYLLYRPDLLAAWEAGRDDGPGRHAGWQKDLWRRLVAELRAATGLAAGTPVGDRLLRLAESLASGAVPDTALPDRVTVFGATTLPPHLVSLLEALARRVPVSLHVPVPTPHFVADLQRRRGQAVEELQGHRLLVNLGQQGREFHARLLRAEDEGARWEAVEDVDAVATEDELEDATMLRIVQEDLRAARVRGVDAPAVPLGDRLLDGTLQVFSCHAPQRELEVLRDLLIDAFERDPALRPGNVVVQVTDIETYAPWIDAVFGAQGDGAPRLPYRVADRRAAAGSATAAAFLHALELVGSRLAAPDVVELLERDPVRRRFGLGARDLDTVRGWVTNAGARWGVDGARRAADFGSPSFEEGSWRLALDRLLAGVALGPRVDPDRLVPLPVPIVPEADGTAGRAATLGEFGRFVETLVRLDARLRRPLPAAETVPILQRAVDDLLAAHDEAGRREIDAVRAAIEALEARLQTAGCADEPVGIATLRDELALRLDEDRPGAEFLSGTITFCALQPLRSVPFDVVCVLGLDDGAFPRRDRALPFDLIQARPRPGDRSPRGDDRQLFLETLLAPRKALILGRVGRSAHTNTERAPSPVLEELLELLGRTFELPVDAAGRHPSPRAVFEVEHPLHAHSARYVDGEDPRLFTYRPRTMAPADAEDALRLVEPAGAPPAEGPIPCPAVAASTVELDELVAFWKRPQRQWCEAALGASPRDASETLEEIERLGLDVLSGYEVRDLALERHREARVLPAAPALAQAGSIPPRALGRAWLEKQLDATAPILARLPQTYLEDLPFAIDGDGWRLLGVLDALTATGRITGRAANTKGRDGIDLWIRHLVLCVLASRADTEVPPTSTHVGAKDAWTLRAVPETAALGHLDDLVRGRRCGLERPLPFFPDVAERYVEQARKLRTSKRAKKSALDVARDAFEAAQPGDESQRPDVRLCFRGIDVFAECGAAFEAWTLRLLGGWIDQPAPVAHEKSSGRGEKG